MIFDSRIVEVRGGCRAIVLVMASKNSPDCGVEKKMCRKVSVLVDDGKERRLRRSGGFTVE